jgi:integrase
MKLEEALQYFLRVPRASQTQETYRKVLTPFVDEIGPGRPLNLIRPEDLDAYVSDLLQRRTRYETHSRRRTERGGLSEATINKHIKTIKRFFNWCVEREYLDESPARFLTRRPANRPFNTGKAATDDEVSAILSVARHKPRDWAIVLLLAQTGCRAGEIATLRIRDLDLEQLKIVVTGKGNKRRVVIINPETAQALRDWLEMRPQDTDHDFVFTSTRGHGPLNAASISELTRRLCKLARLKRSLGAHAFRHFVALKLSRAHVAPTVIKEYLGHSSLTTTMTYLSSVNDGDLRKAGKLLSLVRGEGEEPDKKVLGTTG